jgi:hypothetical protein
MSLGGGASSALDAAVADPINSGVSPSVVRRDSSLADFNQRGQFGYGAELPEWWESES